MRATRAATKRESVANANMGLVLEVLDRCPACRAAVRDALRPALQEHQRRRSEFHRMLGGELVETEGESTPNS